MIDSVDLSLQQILNRWGLRLYSWQKIRDVYKVETDQGLKNLKMSPYIPSRLVFVHQAVKHLSNNGFQKMVPLIPTMNGDTYVVIPPIAYTLYDWIEGRQCIFKNEPELIGSTQALAELHEKSIGFNPPLHSNMRDHLGKCLKHFEERYQELFQFREIALTKPSDPYASLYLKHFNFFRPMAEIAIQKIKQSAYPQLVADTRRKKTFCHGDPAARNFICTPDQNIYVIDFDSFRLDLPIMDLIKFTRRVMKKHQWHYPTAKLLFDSYQSVCPLTWSELEVMKAVFYFPQKYWRLSNRYFRQHPHYTADRLLHKFQKYINNKDYFSEFQDKFNDYKPFGE